jgi:hypothetical protein
MGRTDGDLSLGLSGVGTVRLDLGDEVETLEDLAEDDVLAVQPRGLDGGDEELGAVGSGTGVSHREKSGLGVLDCNTQHGKKERVKLT